jgi:hypothetical protein
MQSVCCSSLVLHQGHLSRLFDLNAVVGVTDKTSQHPKQHAYHENDPFLGSSEISRENVYECDRTTNYAQVEPS